jgi:GT2 family glycosyltransferase
VPFIRAPETIGDFGSSAYLGCPGCLFDAESFRRTGGLDERFKNANDVELWVRLSKLGSFITTDKVVANIRYIESSDGNRDPLAGIAALIALNYIHGYPGVSKTILARYADRHAAVMSMDRGALAKAIARRTIGGFKRRLVRALRGFKGNR